MTRITCNECGKELSYGTKLTIGNNGHEWHAYMVLSHPPNYNTDTKDFCSYKCIGVYATRLSDK